MGIVNKKMEPDVNNLPDGTIDWIEISRFIEDMLNPQYRVEKGWKLIKDISMSENLQQNSILVLNILYDDLYGFFYKLNGDRNEVWTQMEAYIRTKYSRLSDNALSRIITTYHIDDK